MPVATASTKVGEYEIKAGSPVIIDLGKQSRKQIRRLRNGTGKLLAQVNEVVDQLKADGTVNENAQPIVIVVRQKRRTSAMFPFA